MKTTFEHEVKLTPPDGFTLPDVGGERRPERTFVSTYHDTSDLRLARYGVTLRHRVEEGAGLWQLKIPRGVARIELEQAGPPARPPGELLALLPAFLRGEGLVRVARLRTRRQTIVVDGVEVVDDAIAVFDGARIRRRFRELEIEYQGGNERSLKRVLKALERAGATPGELWPKLFRALDLAPQRGTATIGRKTPPGAALAIQLSRQYEGLLEHDPGTRLGTDPEDLHQMRVATRRLRAFLRAAAPLVDPDWTRTLQDELGWLGRGLGPARDLDVLQQYLENEIGQLEPDGAALAGLIESVEADREAARAAAIAELTSTRYLTLLDRLDEAAEPPLSGAEIALRDIFAQELDRTAVVVAALPEDPTDNELHGARIQVKRARYAAELAAGELGKKSGGFVDAAKEVQDVLGEHQDAVVAEDVVRTWLTGNPSAALAGGRLIERQRMRRDTARAAWPGAWRQLERAGRKATG